MTVSASALVELLAAGAGGAVGGAAGAGGFAGVVAAAFIDGRPLFDVHAAFVRAAAAAAEDAATAFRDAVGIAAMRGLVVAPVSRVVLFARRRLALGLVIDLVVVSAVGHNAIDGAKRAPGRRVRRSHRG